MLLCSFVTVARFPSVVAWLVRSTCVSVIYFAIVFMFVAVIWFTPVVVARSYYSFVLVCVIVVWFVKFARVRDRAASYHSIVCVIVSGSYHSFMLVCVIVVRFVPFVRARVRDRLWFVSVVRVRDRGLVRYRSFVPVCVIVARSWFVVVVGFPSVRVARSCSYVSGAWSWSYSRFLAVIFLGFRSFIVACSCSRFPVVGSVFFALVILSVWL